MGMTLSKVKFSGMTLSRMTFIRMTFTKIMFHGIFAIVDYRNLCSIFNVVNLNVNLVSAILVSVVAP